MNKIGKKRDPNDQFYTDRNVSLKCIQLLFENLQIEKSDIIIEPSAGDGSFSDHFIDKEYNIESYDIDPKKDYITKQNYLELVVDKYMNSKKKIHCVGNPPFGRQSSMAKKFIKKSALFCHSISFILPKSFRKDSCKKSFPLNFHLIKEYDIEDNAFIIDGKKHNVPCIFQIWIKKEEDRDVEPLRIETGFKFVKQPSIKDIEIDENGKPIRRDNIFTEYPDFGILRAGGGRTCGRISLNFKNGISCYPEAWLFIKLNDNYNRDKFYEEYKKINWEEDANVGAKSISKPIFIKGINKLLEAI